MLLNRDIHNKYRDLLTELEWRDFSRQVIKHYGGICWNCGSKQSLQSHHLVYRDVLPWEYQMHEMRCLCSKCHTQVHAVADLIWLKLIKFEPHELEIILSRLNLSAVEFARVTDSDREACDLPT